MARISWEVKTDLKIWGTILLVILFCWAMLINGMYETADEQKLLCVSSGGSWEKPDIKPWNLVEGVCHRS